MRGQPLPPQLVQVLAQYQAVCQNELEGNLEAKTLLHSDMVHRWSTDEEELFFEVIGNDEVRLALKKQCRRRMVEWKWTEKEGTILRQLLA
jgi:hypothetical protein